MRNFELIRGASLPCNGSKFNLSLHFLSNKQCIRRIGMVLFGPRTPFGHTHLNIIIIILFSYFLHFYCSLWIYH